MDYENESYSEKMLEQQNKKIEAYSEFVLVLLTIATFYLVSLYTRYLVECLRNRSNASTWANDPPSYDELSNIVVKIDNTSKDHDSYAELPTYSELFPAER